MDEILESEFQIETEPCFPEPDFFDSLLVGCTDEAGVRAEPATSAPVPPIFPESILDGIPSGDGSDLSEIEEMMGAAEGMLGGTNVEAQDFPGQTVEKKDAGDDVQPSTKNNATVNGNVAPSPKSSAGPDIFEKSEDEDNYEGLSEQGDKPGDEKMEVDEDKDTVEEDVDKDAGEEDEDKDEGEEDEDKKTDEETHNASDSPALSRASTVVNMSVPKISISPKRKILNSPVRNTRGRLNDSVGREKPTKRRLSESEGESGSVYSSESNDEEPGSTTRSGKPVRKSPRTSNKDVSNNLRSRPERKRKRTARYVEDEEDVTSSGGSKHKRESKYHQDRKINDDDDDSDMEMFTPIKAKKKPSRSPNYKINADGSVTLNDKDGRITEIPKSRVKLARLTTDLLRKYGKACDETETSSGDESRSQHGPNNPFLLEVCVDNITSVEEAVKGGAKRIELCSSLSEGGLTPASGFLTYVKEKYEVPVFVMIRPRGGDFVYSEAEIDIMERDITYLSQLGADGFVFGALTKDSKVDVESCRRLLKSANQLPCTFHRAFDKVADPLVALETIISLKFTRILTSGQAATAQQGLGQLSRLVKAAKKRIIILPGAGVNVGNVSTIVKRTEVHEVHGSASKTVQTTMAVAGPSQSSKRGARKSRTPEQVKMGTTDDSIIKVTDRTKVAEMVRRGQASVKY